VKARLARIENKRRLTDSKNTNKPSLRKAGTGSGDSSGSSSPSSTTSTSSDDDKPTLHRRDDQN
jgi:beta-barrel assembly-enhancing protease